MKHAVLDKVGMLIGYVAKATEAPPHARDVLKVPDDCDLVPGRYRYDYKRKTFVPVMAEHLASKLLEEPNTLRAIAKGFIALRENGAPLPAETLEWLAWWEASIDAKG